MWKALLVLLALGVIFIIVLKMLERWSLKAKNDSDKRLPLDRQGIDSQEMDQSPAEIAEARARSLVAELAGPDVEVAREAASKLLSIGPHAIEIMMPELLRVERGRRNHAEAVLAKRFEDTLIAFGPVAIPPCLELMAAEKGSFEVFRGVRSVVGGMGEAAALPVVKALPWLSDEGLYVRALLLIKPLGPGIFGSLLRAVDSAAGRGRALSTDLLLDLAGFYPSGIRARLGESIRPDQVYKGLMAAADVRYSLLLAIGHVGATAAELAGLTAALGDEDARVRREAWGCLGTLPEATDVVKELPLDPDPAAACAQTYARDRLELPALEGDRGARLEVARMGVDVRRAAGASLEPLENALLEGPLEARREAAEALAYVGGPEAGKVLARGLRQTPVTILPDVAQALGRTPCEAAVAALFDLWEERGGNAIRRSIRTLGELGIPKLTEYVKRRNPRLMEQAALVLGRLGAAARPPLMELLGESRPEDPALFAVEVAMEVQGTDAVPDLIPLLDHPQLHVAEVVAWVLGLSGDPRALAPLLAQLSRLEDRFPILDLIRRGPDSIRAATLEFLAENPHHPDADALRQAAE